MVQEKETENHKKNSLTQPATTMRAGSKGKHKPNLQTTDKVNPPQQVIPIAIGTALRLSARR
jgi:hypothetical protein